jgi:hypothetical protein
MRLNKAAKKYRIIVEAFAIIQEMQPIQTIEVCRRILANTGYEINYGRLGQYLRPFVNSGQLLRITKTGGTYYTTGKQAIKAHTSVLSDGK